METNKILQADYLDLVFDNRNKSYGSYELRKHYTSRTFKALSITFTAILLGIGTPFVLSRLNAKATIVIHQEPKEIVLSNAFADNVPEPPEPPAPPEPALPPEPPKPVAPTVTFTPPVIVPDKDIDPDTKPPSADDMKDKIAGPVNNDGMEGGIAPALDNKPYDGPFGSGDRTDNDKKGGGRSGQGSDEPFVSVEIMPEFPGGKAALMAYIQRSLRYPVEALEADIEGRVIISFVVNAKGEIEDAKVARGIGGGCDKEALRMVNAMPKWKPGRQNGQNVKVYYTLPISFRLKR
jgi:protein TonB